MKNSTIISPYFVISRAFFLLFMIISILSPISLNVSHHPSIHPTLFALDRAIYFTFVVSFLSSITSASLANSGTHCIYLLLAVVLTGVSLLLSSFRKLTLYSYHVIQCLIEYWTRPIRIYYLLKTISFYICNIH